MARQKQILNQEQVNLMLTRLAYEVFENNVDEKEIVLAGIKNRGYAIAEMLKAKIEGLSKLKVRLISIEIDKRNPIDCSLSDDKDLDKKSIIVVDDVANSGRTMLYALHPFLNIIAKKIQIAVLVDRKHKSYPICSDYVGKQISTTIDEHVEVRIEKDVVVGAYLK